MNEHEMLRFIDSFLIDIKRRCYGWMNLKSGDRVLDVGCGLGLDVQRIRQLNGLSIDAVGVDLRCDNWKLTWEVAAGQGALFVGADAARLPFNEHTFDVVWADRLLQHVDHPMKALSEFKRVIKTDGRIVLADSDHTSARVLGNDEVFGQGLMDFRASTIRNASAGRMLHTWCERAGLRAVCEETIALSIGSFDLARKLGFFFGEWHHTFGIRGEREAGEVANFLTEIERHDQLGAFRFDSNFHIALVQK
jgi:ubiquinone/menaquinone biosynthesis C-methylase UbiE